MIGKLNLNVMRSVLAIGAVTLLASCGGNSAQQAQQDDAPVAVATMTVTTGSVNLYDEYPATIKGKSDVEIRPQVSGFITKVCVDEGQHVAKGQLLFLIDDVQLQENVRSAEAAVVAAKSSVATAKLTADNQKKLLEKNIISDYQYQTAALNLQSAQAQLNQANASLVNAKKNLSYARVTAPSAGVVGSIPNREGTLASPSGAALTTISENSQVYAYFSLNEKQIISLTDGGARSLQAAINAFPQVQLRLSDGTIYAQPGRVSTVAGVLNASTGSATVRALFPNAGGMLRSGATGEILVPKNTQNAILVPQSAVAEMQDMKYVFVVGPENKAVSTPIEVLAQNDGKNYVVTKGLKVGDVIVTEGVGISVREGVTIDVQGGNAKAAQEAQAAAAKK